ncbi:hypothetical protein PENSPDRAFT_655230 [Peniophora sp. CONT]|nr:hypothetical protein PENSPDRAFT_655230 [Peniophora sp. CONT]
MPKIALCVSSSLAATGVRTLSLSASPRPRLHSRLPRLRINCAAACAVSERIGRIESDGYRSRPEEVVPNPRVVRVTERLPIEA